MTDNKLRKILSYHTASDVSKILAALTSAEDKYLSEKKKKVPAKDPEQAAHYNKLVKLMKAFEDAREEALNAVNLTEKNYLEFYERSFEGKTASSPVENPPSSMVPGLEPADSEGDDEATNFSHAVNIPASAAAAASSKMRYVQQLKNPSISEFTEGEISLEDLLKFAEGDKDKTLATRSMALSRMLSDEVTEEELEEKMAYYEDLGVTNALVYQTAFLTLFRDAGLSKKAISMILVWAYNQKNLVRLKRFLMSSEMKMKEAQDITVAEAVKFVNKYLVAWVKESTTSKMPFVKIQNSFPTQMASLARAKCMRAGMSKEAAYEYFITKLWAHQMSVTDNVIEDIVEKHRYFWEKVVTTTTNMKNGEFMARFNEEMFRTSAADKFPFPTKAGATWVFDKEDISDFLIGSIY